MNRKTSYADYLFQLVADYREAHITGISKISNFFDKAVQITLPPAPNFLFSTLNSSF